MNERWCICGKVLPIGRYKCDDCMLSSGYFQCLECGEWCEYADNEESGVPEICTGCWDELHENL